LAERFHRPIDTEVPFVIVGILNLLAAATGTDQEDRTEQNHNGKQ